MTEFLVGFFISLPTGLAIWLAARSRRRYVVIHKEHL